MIALIDYGAGNLTSVRKGFAAAGAELFTPSTPATSRGARAIVVPGVGHFARDRGARRGVAHAILPPSIAARLLFGICLGLQWLFEGSDEAPDVPWPRRHARALPPAAADAEGAARRLERARDAAGHRGCSPASPTARRSTSPTRTPRRITADASPPRRTPRRSPRSSRRDASSACSSTRRSPGDGRVIQMSEELRRSLCCRSASSPASTSATAASSRACSSRGCANAGDPAALAARYNVEGIDELVILDVTATLEARRALADTIRAVSSRAVHPARRRRRHPVAGRCRGGDRGRRRQGQPEQRGAGRSGAAHPARRPLRQPGGRRRDRREAGRTAASRSIRAAAAPPPGGDAVEWAREAEARGAGEILLTSIDRDGTREGFDCELTAAVSDAVAIPVIASGGAGTFEHFLEVFTAGRADAALAASHLPLFRARGVGAEAVPRAATACPSGCCSPHADSFDRPAGRPDRPARAGRGLAVESHDIDDWIDALLRLAEGAADRSRRGEGRRAHNDALVARICARAALPGRRRHPYDRARARPSSPLARPRSSSAPRCSAAAAVDTRVRRERWRPRSAPDG